MYTFVKLISIKYLYKYMYTHTHTIYMSRMIKIKIYWDLMKHISCGTKFVVSNCKQVIYFGRLSSYSAFDVPDLFLLLS